jgi:hypothetical protein
VPIAGWLIGVPLNLGLSVLLAAVTTGIYWLSLTHLGALLQRRETEILRAVTTEVE